MSTDPRTPLTLLTGFLGSGKTTLLQSLMQQPDWKHTAIIINEVGEVGLDHLLVEHVAPDVRVLQSGCLCCTVRDDLTRTLAELADRQRTGGIRFDRVIVETTGLADPMPVIHTLASGDGSGRHYRLSGVVTTIDAVNGLDTLQRHAEARRQVAMADLMLLTKTDLVAASKLQTLQTRLRRLNPVTPRQVVEHGALTGVCLFDLNRPPPPLDTGTYRFHVRHTQGIQAHGFVLEAPVDLTALQHWLELLVAMRGDQLLRFKGLLHVSDDPNRPVVVHGAQHVMHPPARLDRWPSGKRQSRLVFIGQGLNPADIERTLHKFAGVQAVATPL